jgi:hypothetical protein
MVERDRKILGWTRGAPMGKLQTIAARAPKIIADLEARAGKLDDRLTALEAKGHGTFDRWEGHLSEQESAVAAAEDAVNQLSNGGPPLDDSSPPSVPFRQPGAGGGAAS